MFKSINIRKIARDIVMVYAHHIKDRVKMKDMDYIKLGVDDDFEEYSALFKAVISRVLGVPVKVDMLYPNIVIVECLNVIEEVVKEKGYEKLLEDKIIAQCVYDVCLYILKKVKEEEFDDNVLYQ